MTPLSEALMGLAARVRRLEDSAAVVREKNRAALQARREETATEARVAVGSRWPDTKASIRRQLEAMRADVKKSQAELVEKDAERASRDADEDASAAVTLAGYCLDAAEWAVVRAELARADADELARAAGRAYLRWKQTKAGVRAVADRRRLSRPTVRK